VYANISERLEVVDYYWNSTRTRRTQDVNLLLLCKCQLRVNMLCYFYLFV